MTELTGRQIRWIYYSQGDPTKLMFAYYPCRHGYGECSYALYIASGGFTRVQNPVAILHRVVQSVAMGSVMCTLTNDHQGFTEVNWNGEIGPIVEIYTGADTIIRAYPQAGWRAITSDWRVSE